MVEASENPCPSDVAEPVSVAGPEVVGRGLAVWNAKLSAWPRAVVSAFDPGTGRHAVRYRSKVPGAPDGDVWLSLGKTRFQWAGKPGAGQAPNPSAAGAPPDEQLVGSRVKVFWPGMAKWYLGKARASGGVVGEGRPPGACGWRRGEGGPPPGRARPRFVRAHFVGM